MKQKPIKKSIKKKPIKKRVKRNLKLERQIDHLIATIGVKKKPPAKKFKRRLSMREIDRALGKMVDEAFGRKAGAKRRRGGTMC